MTRLTWEPITLHFRTPFRVSYGASESRRAHWLRLANDEGWGEGTIPPYYGISDDSMTAVWAAAARRAAPFPDDPADIAAWLAADPVIAAGPAPARAALDWRSTTASAAAPGCPSTPCWACPRRARCRPRSRWASTSRRLWPNRRPS